MTNKNNKAMQYEPVLDAAILNWFDENYIEDINECARIIIKATIDYPFTPKQLQEGCMGLKKTMAKDENLRTHIKLIGDLSNVGMSASIAAEQIREVILRMKR